MASSGKKKTTFAKLARESKLRERRLDKAARKDARKRAAEMGYSDIATADPDAPFDPDAPLATDTDDVRSPDSGETPATEPEEQP